MTRLTSGKPRLVVLGAALMALAFGVSVGLANSGPSKVKVPVQLKNANCGFPTGKKLIGKATFITDKGDAPGVLTVRVKLHGAVPGTYDLLLYDGGNCNFLAGLDTFKVDGSGDGSACGAIAVTGQSFFVDAWNRTTLTDNDSWIAKVGGLG
jgi:hypothetical protein